MISYVEVAQARALARHLLADELPRRWDHVQGVAARAELFADNLPGWRILVAAAYLHDIGYASPLVDTRLHQIDGARFLRRQGWDEAVVNLVAHHSGARARAEIAGLGQIYADEFPRDDRLPHAQLHFCDLTISLDGEPTTVERRLANMRQRHGHNPDVMQFLDDHEDELRQMVADTWSRLGLAAEEEQPGPDGRSGQSVPMAGPSA